MNILLITFASWYVLFEIITLVRWIKQLLDEDSDSSPEPIEMFNHILATVIILVGALIISGCEYLIKKIKLKKWFRKKETVVINPEFQELFKETEDFLKEVKKK